MPPASRGLATLRFVRYASRIPSSPLPRPPADWKKNDRPPRLQEETTFKQDEGQNQSRGQYRKPVSDYFSPSLRHWIWRLFYIVPPVAFVILEFPLEIMWVSGPSMSPLLNVNSSPELPQTSDAILVQKVLFPDRPRLVLSLPKWQIQRGQIIVFYAPHNPEKLAVKRVIGVPGDRIQPLPGYPGGDEPVVVPYNHIWVEGDANSREKSVDSNWYGPISQNLVIGFVKMVLTPWYAPVVVRWEEHDYPAKDSGRIEKDVVHDAKLDPDRKSLSEAFNNGVAARELSAIQRNRTQLPYMMLDQKRLPKLRTMYAQAKMELEQQNPDSQEVAQGLVEELEAAFESVGLSRDGSPLPPAMRPTGDGGGEGGHQDGTEQEQSNLDQHIKQKRLKDYLERQQKKESMTVSNDALQPSDVVTG